MTSRLRKADKVEPMPRPTNSKLRIRKERIYRLSVPVRIARTESLLELLGSRWDPNQIQVNAPHERRTRSDLARLQALLTKLADDHRIDTSAGPRILCRRTIFRNRTRIPYPVRLTPRL